MLVTLAKRRGPSALYLLLLVNRLHKSGGPLGWPRSDIVKVLVTGFDPFAVSKMNETRGSAVDFL